MLHAQIGELQLPQHAVEGCDQLPYFVAARWKLEFQRCSHVLDVRHQRNDLGQGLGNALADHARQHHRDQQRQQRQQQIGQVEVVERLQYLCFLDCGNCRNVQIRYFELGPQCHGLHQPVATGVSFAGQNLLIAADQRPADPLDRIFCGALQKTFKIDRDHQGPLPGAGCLVMQRIGEQQARALFVQKDAG